jgi:F-type H+-transporting ATPase subunit delta
MNVVSRRYARALFDVLPPDQGEVGLVGLLRLSDVLASYPDARELLRNPAVPEERRAAFIEALSRALTLDPRVRRLFALLVERRRMNLLTEVAEAYRNLLDQRTGTLRVEVASAQLLGADEQRDLIQRLENSTGKRVYMNVRQDAGLLGGIVVRMGSTVFDASVRQQLASVRRRLKAD